jgi:GTP cyclohydrolase II
MRLRAAARFGARRHQRVRLGHPPSTSGRRGRAIGLVNKLRAYALQDQGFDTVDANIRLGFGDDERNFAVAARMLASLSQTQVRLLTNNPRKAAGLEIEGVA